MAIDLLSADELELYEPKSEDERRLRALFFSTQIARHSLRLLKKCLDHCEEAAAKAGRTAVLPTTLEHQATLKILTALEIFMTLRVQHDIASPRWLLEFFSAAWTQADMLNPEPPSAKVLEHFPSRQMDYRSYCELVSMQLCHDLKLGEQVDDAILFVSQVIEQGAEARGRILRQAITTPKPELAGLASAGVPV